MGDVVVVVLDLAERLQRARLARELVRQLVHSLNALIKVRCITH